MKINKPKFWDKNLSILSILLLPLTFIYFLLVFIKKKISVSKSFKIPVVCVGNIYLGGTGTQPQFL